MENLNEIIKLLDYCKANQITHIKWGSFEAVVGPTVIEPAGRGITISGLSDEEILSGYRVNQMGDINV